MEKKIKLSVEIPILVLNLIPLFITLLFWNQIPEQVPIHWNIHGEVDGYAQKLITPLLNLGLYTLLLLIMFIDPKKENYHKFRNIYIKIRWLLSMFFVALSSVIVLVAMGYTINMDRFLLISLPLVFSLLGNFMINIKPNWFIGIRTPWTLSNENVWRKTHRLTGMLWFWMGLICFIMGFFIVPKIGVFIIITVTITISLIPIIYSYMLFEKEKKNK